MNDVTYREIEAKSALNRVQGMPFDWSLNPFTGCPHACVYCYARAYHARFRERNVGADFDRNVEVRANIVSALERELWRRPTGSVAIGTATDPYQPIEAKYRLTRGCLQALARHPMPTSIVTKGTLIVRDIDLLRVLDRRTELTVYFSVPTVDAATWRATEPRTPPPWQRLRALRELRDAGLDAAVLCAPLLPGITDSDESIDRSARAASAAGATAFRHRPLRIDSEIREHYFDFLATEFPVLAPRYAELYHGRTHPGREYERDLERRVATIRQRYRFDERAPRSHEELADAAQLQLAM
jgi:DNA repair photolyase